MILFSWVRYVSSLFSHPTTSLPDGKKAWYDGETLCKTARPSPVLW